MPLAGQIQRRLNLPEDAHTVIRNHNFVSRCRFPDANRDGGAVSDRASAITDTEYAIDGAAIPTV
jgi:hypothetical protein